MSRQQAAAQFLRIPTIPAKRIIRMDLSQIPALMNTVKIEKAFAPIDQQSNFTTPAVGIADNAPLSLEQAGGLFDIEFDSKFENLFEKTKFDTECNLSWSSFNSDMLNESPGYEQINSEPTKFFSTEMLDYEQTNSVNTLLTTDNVTTPIDEVEKPQKPKSKFAKKLTEVSYNL